METKKILTLCLVREPSRILLGMKKRGFGEGRWNGFGGKVEVGETIEQATMRELKEECGLIATIITKRGVLDFEFVGDTTILQVHIFEVADFIGDLKETEEMVPKWFQFDEIPFEKMWPDDKYWFPLFLVGKNFMGRFIFSDQNTIKSHRLEEIDNF